MKKIYYLMATVSFLLLHAGCTEVPSWNEGTHDSVPPGAVSAPVVKNISGGAVITYTLPSDNDLLGVKARYARRNDGDTLEAFSSAFVDSIKLVGFPDTQERKIKLVCIDKGRNESKPVEVTIQPLTSPVEIIRQSLVVHETFGGVYVSWNNVNKENIGISLFAEDPLGSMDLDYTYYSNAAKDFYSFRGYENKQRKFRVLVRDRWNNVSSPKDTLLTPEFEEDIVRNEQGIILWERYGYADGTAEWRGDYRGQNGTSGFNNLFDGNLNGLFHPGAGTTYTLPLYTLNPDDAIYNSLAKVFGITIDMKEETKLSRMKYYMRPSSNDNTLTEWNVWATNDTPKGPVDFNYDRIESLKYWTPWTMVGGQGTNAWKNDWVLLAKCLMRPPSGAYYDFEWTDDDIAWAAAGVDFDFDPAHTNKHFRYLRLELIRNFKDNRTRIMPEMEFYGSHVNK
ncbi:MAG: DUF4959 domain-containing protein [Mangrovibacterium sp.]